MILHPVVLLIGYVILGVAPMALAWALGLPPRPVWSETASGMALVGFTMLLLEFVLSGRFRPISRPAGIDSIIRFHQRIAMPMAVLLLLHPFLYVTPSGHPLPWDWSGQHRLGLHGGVLFTGLAAWLILSVLVVTAIWRDRTPYRYEMWRLSHGLGAALVAGLGAHHAIAAGRYSAHLSMATFWLAMLAVAGAALLVVYVVRPLLKLRNPYRVASVRRIALKIWEVVVEPVHGGRARHSRLRAGAGATTRRHRGDTGAGHDATRPVSSSPGAVGCGRCDTAMWHRPVAQPPLGGVVVSLGA